MQSYAFITVIILVQAEDKGTSVLSYCESTHLSTFGTGYFPMPNQIDFEFIFTDFDFQVQYFISLLGGKVTIHKGLGQNVGLSNITFHFPMSNLIDQGCCHLYNYQKYKSDNFIFRFIMNNIFLSTCKMKPLQLP